MPVGKRKHYRDSIISPYPQVNLITWWDWGVISSYARFFRGFLTRLVSIVANATCFQNLRVRCHPCAGLLIPPISRVPRTDWLRCWLVGFSYFSSRYRGRAYNFYQQPSNLHENRTLHANTTINSVVKALASQYRQSKTGFLLLAWCETKSRTSIKEKSNSWGGTCWKFSI